MTFLTGNNYPDSPHLQEGMKFDTQISPLLKYLFVFLLRAKKMLVFLLGTVLSCAIVCWTKLSPLGNPVPEMASVQKGLETCSLLSTCCQLTLINTSPLIASYHRLVAN